MRILKTYETFLENYSEDIKQFVDDNKEYALFREDNFILGFDSIYETFEYISNLLLDDKQITLDQKAEFDNISKEKIYNNAVDQLLLDDTLNFLLDRFNIIVPFYIKTRIELVDTPIDTSLDDIGSSLMDD